MVASTRPALLSCAAPVLVAGGVALAGAAALARPFGLPPSAWAFAAALALGVFALHRWTFALPFRGQRVAVSLDEASVALALLALPAALLPPLLCAPVAVAQVARHRSLLKGAYNVATIAIGTGAASLLHAWLAPLVGAVPSALAATLLFALLTHACVARVFAHVERAPAHRIYLRRHLAPALGQATLGGAGALTLLALWSLHPLALLALVPFAYLAHTYATQRVVGEHVFLVHDRAARLRLALAGAREPRQVAEALLEAVGELFPASNAEVRLTTPLSGAWTRAYPRVARRIRPHQAPLVAPDGEFLGMLEAEIDADDKGPLAEMAPGLLRLLSGEAATALQRLGAQPRAGALWVDLPRKAPGV